MQKWAKNEFLLCVAFCLRSPGSLERCEGDMLFSVTFLYGSPAEQNMDSVTPVVQ